eukprot:jgi/Mesvir1/4712/Mv05635-RA.1
MEILGVDWSADAPVQPRSPQEYADYDLVFSAGPWCYKDRGAYLELLRVRLYPRIPLRRPRPFVPGENLPFTVGRVTRYAPEGDNWTYRVAGETRLVGPPKLAPDAPAFLHATAPDFLDMSVDENTWIDWSLASEATEIGERAYQRACQQRNEKDPDPANRRRNHGR